MIQGNTFVETLTESLPGSVTYLDLKQVSQDYLFVQVKTGGDTYALFKENLTTHMQFTKTGELRGTIPENEPLYVYDYTSGKFALNSSMSELVLHPPTTHTQWTYKSLSLTNSEDTIFVAFHANQLDLFDIEGKLQTQF